MKKLLIATTNPAKLAELKKFLSDLPFETLSLSDVGITESVEETGKTLEENAILKARFYAKKSGLLTLADDGGFEIDALGGAPGVKSRRWIHGDLESSDEELINYAISKLKGVPMEKRGAQLHLVLALATPGKGKVYTSEDSVRGFIPLKLSTKREKGFPYRSLLFFPKFGKFYGELTPKEHEELNHRKKALEKLRPILEVQSSF